MAPRSRTGKLMQGLFGRFGKQQPEPPDVFTVNSRYDSTQIQTELDDREFPSANRFDNDEETNWDDAEAIADGDSPIVYAQPIAPPVAPPVTITLDPDDWDEALPAATVSNGNVQEVRRSKPRNSQHVAAPPTENVWDENLPSRSFSTNSNRKSTSAKSNQVVGTSSLSSFRRGDANADRLPEQKENRAIGIWTAILYQFRQILPASVRQLSDGILTVLVLLTITASTWIFNSLFSSGVDATILSQPPAIVSSPVGSVTASNTSPEQAFIEAIQSQLSDITSQYSDDVIQTLSVDLDRNLLVVQLKSSWYLISDDKQNQVTDKIWIQAKENKFTQLQIQDAQGISIARSPVVGNHPIILQRRR